MNERSLSGGNDRFIIWWQQQWQQQWHQQWQQQWQQHITPCTTPEHKLCEVVQLSGGGQQLTPLIRQKALSRLCWTTGLLLQLAISGTGWAARSTLLLLLLLPLRNSARRAAVAVATATAANKATSRQ
jgi:hypothetical protein